MSLIHRTTPPDARPYSRPTHRRALVATVMLCLAIGLLFYLLLDSSPAHAQAESQSLVGEAEPPARMSAHPISLRLEPGVALALSSPQSDRTDPGFGQTIKLFIGLTPFLEAGPSATFTTLPTTQDMGDAGTSWSAGGGARLLRPRDAAPGRTGFAAISPWLDADLLYVRTGELDRLGFATAVGASFPLDQRRRLWLGPYVRYFQIVQGERDGFDNRDAKLLTVGLSLEISPGLRASTRVSSVVAPPLATVAEPEPAAPPPIEPVAVAPVQPEKIEVTQKISFEWNSARLREDSGPALDEVVLALQQNPGFRVDVEGHASSDGGDEHNQKLSEGRALSVLDYLAAHGVARERLASRGFSSSAPLQSNNTLAGRQSNRRVEFTVSFILVSEAAGQGSTQLQQGSTP
jgi:outer membrane protein OmpA-like peptidoglycan-associated protein